MLKRILPIAIIGAALISNTACKHESDFKTVKGVSYKIVKDAPGKTAAMGDVVEYNLVAKVDTMELGNTWKQNMGKPAMMRVEEAHMTGDLLAIFPKLSAGDSAIAEISCDTIIANMAKSGQPMQQLPPWMKKGKKITFNISVVSVKSMEDYKKEMDQKKAEQAKADDQALQDYLTKNNIKAQKTASGLYYTIEKEGTGAQITKGQTVSMMYTGKNTMGKTFDSNRDTTFHHANALTFKVGMGQMIPGVDEGATLLKKGSKATLYIPSTLGYGPQAVGPDLPANSILIFDVDITDVKAGNDKPMPEPLPTK